MPLTNFYSGLGRASDLKWPCQRPFSLIARFGSAARELVGENKRKSMWTLRTNSISSWLWPRFEKPHALPANRNRWPSRVYEQLQVAQHNETSLSRRRRHRLICCTMLLPSSANTIEGETRLVSNKQTTTYTRDRIGAAQLSGHKLRAPVINLNLCPLASCC